MSVASIETYSRPADAAAEAEAAWVQAARESFPWLRQLETSGIDVTLMVPCYNEEANVVDTLNAICAAADQVGCTYEIIVIDDCSQDQTSARVREFQARHPDRPVRLHRNRRNRGLARNFFDGAFMARGHHYRLVCGDNVEPVATLVEIFRQIGTYDIVLPYHVEVKGRKLGRRALSKLFTGIVNTLSGYKLHYYNGAPLFRTFDVLRWHVEATGFGFQAEFVTRLLDAGATYKELPVTAQERVAGKPRALTPRNWMSASYTLLKIGLRSLRRWLFNERKLGLV